MANKIGATVCCVCGKTTLRNVNGEMRYRSVQGMCLSCSSMTYTKARRLKNKAVHGNTNGTAGSLIRRSNANRCQRWGTKLKEQMVAAYGGKCACCGETNPVFLTLDHKNGDGAEERRQHPNTNFGGATIYKSLRDRGWPRDNYQLLCYNCNLAKAFWGKCPHDSRD